MKFFLAKQVAIVFDKNTFTNRNDVYFRKVSFPASLKKMENKRCCTEVCNKVMSIDINDNLLLEVGIHSDWKIDKTVVRVSGGTSMEQLYSVANNVNASFQAVLVMHNLDGDSNVCGITAKCLTTGSKMSKLSENTFGFEWNALCFSNWGANGIWGRNGSNIWGKLDIILTLKPQETDDRFCYASKLNLNVLNNGIGADLSIIPSNGKPVTCHRTVLMAQGAAFADQIQGTFGEAKSNFLKMPDLNEESVRALLEYMYLGDTSKAEKQFTIAMDLYVAAQKYDLKDLKGSMRKLLVSKEDNWFHVDALLKLYLHERDNPDEHDLKLKAVKLLKENLQTILTSDSMLQFFKDDPKGALELTGLLAK